MSAPRAGSTLLYEQLSALAGIWSIGGESHGIFRAFPELRAEDVALISGRLDERHAKDEIRLLLPACFACLLRDHAANYWLTMNPRPAPVCFLEKTPRNALNIPFLTKVFPRARFIYLQRDPRENIASLIEAWQFGLERGRFVTFRDLPGWDRPGWCFLLPRGWQALIGRPLAEIAAFQWRASNDCIIDDLAALPATQHVAVSYRDLVNDCAETFKRLCRFAGIDEQAPGHMALSRTTLTPPAADKWKKYETEIEALLPSLEKTAARMQAFSENRSPS